MRYMHEALALAKMGSACNSLKFTPKEGAMYAQRAPGAIQTDLQQLWLPKHKPPGAAQEI